MKKTKANNSKCYHGDEDLVVIHEGKIHLFEVLPATEIESSSEHPELQSGAGMALNQMGMSRHVTRLRHYATCYYGKSNALDDFNRLIQRLLARDGQFSKIQAPCGQLTKAEVRVLIQVAQDKSDIQIAKELFLSPYTVSTHVQALISKVGCRSRCGLVIFAMQKKLVS